jgi:hypothetical protein
LTSKLPSMNGILKKAIKWSQQVIYCNLYILINLVESPFPISSTSDAEEHGMAASMRNLPVPRAADG